MGTAEQRLEMLRVLAHEVRDEPSDEAWAATAPLVARIGLLVGDLLGIFANAPARTGTALARRSADVFARDAREVAESRPASPALPP
jgi:hypothetical protein